jgi:hypothetical protein
VESRVFGGAEVANPMRSEVYSAARPFEARSGNLDG